LIVVDIGDGRIADVGVAGVDAVEVSGAGDVPRHISFPGTERKPAHVAAATERN
jgi:hypothetical protein